jgi:hypothetical protein
LDDKSFKCLNQEETEESSALYEAFSHMSEEYDTLLARYSLIRNNEKITNSIFLGRQFLFDASQDMRYDPEDIKGPSHDDFSDLFPNTIINYAKTRKSSGDALADALCNTSNCEYFTEWLYQGDYKNKQIYKKNQEKFAKLWIYLDAG